MIPRQERILKINLNKVGHWTKIDYILNFELKPHKI